MRLKIAVSVISFDHICDTLAALHPRLDQLGEHLEDPLAGATRLLENGGSDTTELEPKVVPLFVPPPLLEIHHLYFWRERLGFDGRIIRVIREATERGGGSRGRGGV